MASSYTIDLERKMVFKTHLGIVTAQEDIETLDAVLSDPTYRKGMDFYCDLTRAEANWSVAEIEHFQRYISKLTHLTGKCRWAVIFSPSADLSSPEKFVELHAGLSHIIEIKIFTDRDAAMAWLDNQEIGNSTAPLMINAQN